jgi:hypothetical protein
MNTIIAGILAFLIVSPAIGDEVLNNKNANEKESVTRNPQPYYNNFNANTWYDRQIRAPLGFSAMRGKKDAYDNGYDVNYDDDVSEVRFC